MSTPENPSESKLRAALELLSDPDDTIASMALETIVNSGKAEPLLAIVQDAPDDNTRRRAHQLGAMLQQEHFLQEMVSLHEQAKLDILQAMNNIDLLYDTSSSQPYLEKLLAELRQGFKPHRRPPKLAEITRYMEKEGFYVPPLPWLAIDEYLLGDVLSGDGAGIPLVLAALCQFLGRAYGLEISIVTCNGFVGILSDDKLCILENGWECHPVTQDDEICKLNNQQALRIYLSTLLTSSIASWEIYDTHLFLHIFQKLYGLTENPLPYPFGSTTFDSNDITGDAK